MHSSNRKFTKLQVNKTLLQGTSVQLWNLPFEKYLFADCYCKSNITVSRSKSKLPVLLQKHIKINLVNTVFFFFFRMRLRPIVGQPGNSSITSRVKLRQTTVQLGKRAGFEWDIVWVSPQEHRSVSVRHHVFLQGPTVNTVYQDNTETTILRTIFRFTKLAGVTKVHKNIFGNCHVIFLMPSQKH